MSKKEVIKTAIGSILKSRRELLGITQEDLAESIKCSPMTIQFIEQGRRFPSWPMLIKILDKLGLYLDFVPFQSLR